MVDENAAAQRRVEALLERLMRVDLQVVVVASPDATRMAARERARAAAVAAGRSDLFDEASAAARETTLRAFSRGGFSGTWAATETSVSIASASDRVAAAAAVEEAAMAAAVEDLVDEDTIEVLRVAFEGLDRSTGIPSPGSLATFAKPAIAETPSRFQVALLIVFITGCGAVWIVVGARSGLLVLALGLAIVAGLARRSGTGS